MEPPTIILEAGHTLHDPGAVSGPLQEHTIARSVVHQVAPLLRAEGLDVQVTPEDLNYWAVQAWALDRTDNGMFVALHVNAGRKSYGAVYTSVQSPEGRRAMTAIRARLAKAIPREWNTYLLPSLGWDRAWNTIKRVAGSTKPVCGVLIELPFIDGPDAPKLYTPEGLTTIAKALAEGIQDWVRNNSAT